ncbi:MAG TPA: phosphohistidine phosphatase SixA [Kofleriaceae bacterium]|jgi:phosphohistidine phosphatase
MQVFLVRHAEAVHETAEVRDGSRHLTLAGRDQARALGDRMRWHDCGPTHAFTSPLVRAVQTAEMVLFAMDSKTQLEAMPHLVPDGNAHEVVAALRGFPQDAEVMLCGHDPSLSAIAALLTKQAAFGAIAKAECVRIDGERVRWRFKWDAEAPKIRPSRPVVT